MCGGIWGRPIRGAERRTASGRYASAGHARPRRAAVVLCRRLERRRFLSGTNARPLPSSCFFYFFQEIIIYSKSDLFYYFNWDWTWKRVPSVEQLRFVGAFVAVVSLFVFTGTFGPGVKYIIKVDF